MEEIDTFAGTVGIAAYNHALWSVAKLPKAIHDVKLETFVRNACLESWYLNARLLCEFFGIVGGDDSRDYKAKEFATTLLATEIRKELFELWLIASKLVSHLSKMRNPKEFPFEVDYSRSNLNRLARLFLDVSDAFEKSLQAIDSDYSDLINVANASARAVLDFGFAE